MVLSRIPEERRTGRRRTKLLAKYGTKTHVTKTIATSYTLPHPSDSSTRSASQTTAIANETLSSTSSSTDDTLSMISTPWNTESSFFTPSIRSPGSFTTNEPRTTTTYGNSSPGINTGSNLTVTILGDVASSLSGSRYNQPLTRKTSGSTPTYASWSLETYTSTGLVSSCDRDWLKVNYPWSPSTFVSDTLFTDYPSTLTLISQKGSREGFGKFEARKPMTPMNYVVLTKDDHPMLDWILVKQKGIPFKRE